MDKKLTFVVPKINKRDGQERSSFEVLSRLVKNGWNLQVISFELEDWPDEYPIKWVKVPYLSLIHISEPTRPY